MVHWASCKRLTINVACARVGPDSWHEITNILISVYFHLKLIFFVECQTDIALWGKISEPALF